MLLILAGLHGCHKYVDEQKVSRVESPDHRNVITVDLIQYGNSFGPLLYAVRIEPKGDRSDHAERQDLIEVDDVGDMPPPTVRWDDANSVIVTLQVKANKLSEAIRNGLKTGHAADHYGAVRVTYRAGR